MPRCRKSTTRSTRWSPPTRRAGSAEQPIGQPGLPLHQRRREQMLLGGEVAVGGAEGDSGPLGDELHLHVVDAALGSQLHDGGQQRLPPLQLAVGHALDRLRSRNDTGHP